MPSKTPKEKATKAPPKASGGRANALQKPLQPSEELAAVVGGPAPLWLGVEKNNVEEYCVSEGWIRLAVGKSVDRTGAPLSLKLQGTVEPYFRGAPQ